MDVVKRYKLDDAFRGLNATFRTLCNSRDVVTFFLNLNQFIQILTQTGDSVRSQRNVYGTQLPCVLLLNIFGFLPPLGLGLVCKNWWSALKSPLAKMNMFQWKNYYHHHLRPFYLHQELDCVDNKGNWLPARIKAIDSSFVYIHYLYWDDSWDEWINGNSPRLALLGSKSGLPRIQNKKKIDIKKEIFPGATLWIWDSFRKNIRAGKVIKVDIKEESRQGVLVDQNFFNFQQEWLNIDSPLLFSETLPEPIEIVFKPWDGT